MWYFSSSTDPRTSIKSAPVAILYICEGSKSSAPTPVPALATGHAAEISTWSTYRCSSCHVVHVSGSRWWLLVHCANTFPEQIHCRNIGWFRFRIGMVIMIKLVWLTWHLQISCGKCTVYSNLYSSLDFFRHHLFTWLCILCCNGWAYLV